MGIMSDRFVTGSHLRGKARRAMTLSQEGVGRRYKPHANDPVAMWYMLRHWLSGSFPMELNGPTEVGEKVHVVASEHAREHPLWHHCKPGCAMSRETLVSYLAASLAWHDETRPDLAHKPVAMEPHSEQEEAFGDAEIAKMAASGVIGPAGDTAVLLQPIFVASKLKFTPNAETSAAAASGDTSAVQKAAGEAAARILQEAEARVRTSKSVKQALWDASKAGAQATRLRLVYDARYLSSYLAPLPFELPSVHTIFGSVKKGSYIACVDLKAAFHLLVINKKERCYWGFEWKGTRYVWKRVPFGCSMSPYACCLLTAECQAIFNRLGLRVTAYYLDDGILVGDTKEEVEVALLILAEVAARLGVELSPAKTRAPATRQLVLGVIIDTTAAGGPCLEIPAEKWYSISVTVRLALGVLAASDPKGQALFPGTMFQSLVGSLSWVASYHQAARPYMHTLYYASDPKGEHSGGSRQWVDLNAVHGLKSALEWWAGREPTRPIRAMRMVYALAVKSGGAQAQGAELGTAAMTSDASGDTGFGTIANGLATWGRFDPKYLKGGVSSAMVELYGMLSGLITHGAGWSGRCVVFNTDSRASAYAVNAAYSDNQRVRKLVKAILTVAESYRIFVVAEPLPRECNSACDVLSKATTIEQAASNVCAFALLCSWGDITVIHAAAFNLGDDGRVAVTHHCKIGCTARHKLHPTNATSAYLG